MEIRRGSSASRPTLSFWLQVTAFANQLYQSDRLGSARRRLIRKGRRAESLPARLNPGDKTGTQERTFRITQVRRTVSRLLISSLAPPLASLLASVYQPPSVSADSAETYFFFAQQNRSCRSTQPGVRPPLPLWPAFPGRARGFHGG